MSTPGNKRVPLRVRLPFADEAEFVARYGSHVSEQRIFIATRNPKPLGTPLAFELVLVDGVRIMRGEGTVERVTDGVSGQPGNLPGMDVRLTRIDAKTKLLLDSIVNRPAPVAEAAAAPSALEAPVPADAPPPVEPVEPSPVKLQVTLSERPTKKAAVPCVGIDFGSRMCRMAAVIDGKAQVISLGEQPTVLTALWRDERSRSWRFSGEPSDTCYRGFKRLLGRRARSKSAQLAFAKLPFSVKPDLSGDFGLAIGDEVFSFVELASQVLLRLRALAEQPMGGVPTKAVLATPAYFNDHQRQALLLAAQGAGLEVVRLVNEPTAVALAFGSGRGLARKRMLVYDLGGGTFDVSVVEMTGDDVEVISAGGDSFLGGDDFDAVLVDSLLPLLSLTQRQQVLQTPIAMLKLNTAVEEAKVRLSSQVRTTLRIDNLLEGTAMPASELRVDLERSFVEAVTEPLVQRTLEVTKAVLGAAKLKPEQLDEVLVVGGQSKQPLVLERLQKFLGRPVRVDETAGNGVALGAALLGHAAELAHKGKRSSSVSEVLTASIGISMRGGTMRRVFDVGTRLPVRKSVGMAVAQPGPMTVGVFQGEHSEAKHNDYLGSLDFTVVIGGEVTLSFELSVDGQLSIQAQGATGKNLTAAFVGRDSTEAVEEALFREAPQLEPNAVEKRSGVFAGLKRLFRK
jgi:molecular chaperone DnaK